MCRYCLRLVIWTKGCEYRTCLTCLVLFYHINKKHAKWHATHISCSLYVSISFFVRSYNTSMVNFLLLNILKALFVPSISFLIRFKIWGLFLFYGIDHHFQFCLLWKLMKCKSTCLRIVCCDEIVEMRCFCCFCYEIVQCYVYLTW